MGNRKSNRKAARRNNRVAPSQVPKDHVQEFTSNGAVGKSDVVGNRFVSLTLTGNPFDASQDGAWQVDVCSFAVGKYFLPDFLSLWEYYRVVECETTFYWKSPPKTGPIMGELYYALDRDSRVALGEANANKLMNRRDLSVRRFTSEKPAIVVKWRPHLVENKVTESTQGAELDLVIPRQRWLNTTNNKDHRFGALRYVVTTPAKGIQYDSSPAVGFHHRVKIQLKALKTMQ